MLSHGFIPNSRFILLTESNHLNSEFLSLIISDFALSFRLFFLEKDALALSFAKIGKNLREKSADSLYQKFRVQVMKRSIFLRFFEQKRLES